jgi:hypothetical protein
MSARTASAAEPQGVDADTVPGLGFAWFAEP